MRLSALFNSSERIPCIAEGPNGLLAVAANTSSATALRFPAKLVIWNRNTNNVAFDPSGRRLLATAGNSVAVHGTGPN